MLTFDNVSLSYGSFLALDGVSLHAETGELVVLARRQRRGQELHLPDRQRHPQSRRRQHPLRRQELVGRKPSQIVATGLVQCPEGRKLFPQMSVLKNLMLGAYVHRGDRRATASASKK